MADTSTHILLIEDNPGDAKLIRHALTTAAGFPFELEHAATLQAGLERLKAGGIDVMLLDLNLPDSQGLQTAAAVLKAAPETPIVVMSGTDAPQTILDTIKVGIHEYFVKSRFTGEELADAILRQATRSRRFWSSEAARVAPKGNRPSAQQNTVNVRVLILEDNAGDLALLRRMLRSADGVKFEIQHAPKLSAALELMRYGADIVLLDLDVPDSRGLDTLRRLRAEERSTPIIVLTGLNDRNKAVEALSNGAQDYLVKGQVDARLLERAILRHVKASTETSLQQASKL